jgi:hypothetical protein
MLLINIVAKLFLKCTAEDVWGCAKRKRIKGSYFYFFFFWGGFKRGGDDRGSRVESKRMEVGN